MNKAQTEAQKEQLKDELETIKRLKQVYKKARKDCEEKIRELSMRKDLENLQSIIHQKRYQEILKKQLDQILNLLQKEEFSSIQEYLLKSYENGYIGVMYDLHKQGIPIIIPINQEQVVKAVETDSKLSKGLYQRLDEDMGKLKQAVRVEVSRGIANGSGWNQVAEQIANGMNSPFAKAINRAITIARTEGHRIQQQSSLDSQYAARGKGADIVKQWDSTLDGRTRPEHRKADGQIRELDEPFNVGGEKMQAPGVGGSAKNVCNCRCCLTQRARWALDEEELETMKKRAEYFGLDKTKNFDEYKEKYLQASERGRKDVQKINDIEGLGNGNKTVYNSAKLGETTDKWSKEAKEELLLDERSLSVRKKETACVYSGDGKFLFQKRGEVSEVQFGIRDLFRLKGTVIIHNHPTGGSFSDSDIYFLFFSKAAEIRVSTENCSYYIRQPSKWDKAIKSKEKIVKERNKIRDSVKEKYNQLYKEGKITKTERYRMASDEVNAIFCEKFGIEYGKETFED